MKEAVNATERRRENRQATRDKAADKAAKKVAYSMCMNSNGGIVIVRLLTVRLNTEMYIRLVSLRLSSHALRGCVTTCQGTQ